MLYVLRKYQACIMLAMQSFSLNFFFMPLPETDDDYYIVEIYFPLLKVEAEQLLDQVITIQ